MEEGRRWRRWRGRFGDKKGDGQESNEDAYAAEAGAEKLYDKNG